ncbi:hypothetical protein [Kibdelosporangium aridum]|uniref:ArsR family transcriptional regulator n=1 Tax=Kibdelosporangium aridum TaxID=2030 RepID=A0A1Y5YAP0_KIBAR|nr:hypothetical protein [Kibdelosporangium aridum]SMD27626.1 hypothetical protein SAMN05661093_11236 [Kibdelosporangium aridum]
MANNERDRSRHVSGVVFGNRHRLELLVALAKAGDDGVCLSQLSDARGVPASVYYAPIRGLISVGLVDKLGRTRGDRRCWYRRHEGQDRFWSCVQALAGELSEVETS